MSDDRIAALEASHRALTAAIEDLVQWLKTEQATRLAAIEDKQRRHERRLDDHETRIDDLVIAVHALETGAPKPTRRRGKK